jgi:S-adenosylmethionine synthetase
MEILVRASHRPPIDEIEVVEHKGPGHPDSICDALAEELSRTISRVSLERWGAICHHNVDKALLVGGSAAVDFGQGIVTAPIRILLGGRVSAPDGQLDVEGLAVDGARRWLKKHLHALDPERHVRIECLTRAGSSDLIRLFSGQARGEIALANDTSVGVGHAPRTPLESTVLSAARALRELPAKEAAIGEDFKLMGLRRGARTELTVACALIGPRLASPSEYLDAKRRIAAVVAEAAGGDASVTVNAADDPAQRRWFLTVTGTSAEAGDDGQVGRGNRGNGLITPYQPMTIEALAGKNPVSHVGKLYSIAAQAAADAIAALPEVVRAEVMLVSQIGRRVDDPWLADLQLLPRDGLSADLAAKAELTLRDEIAKIPELWRRIID